MSSRDRMVPTASRCAFCKSPLGHLISRPLVRSFHPRRSSQTWTDDVAEITQRLHYLRSIHALVFDSFDRIVWIRCGSGVVLRRRGTRAGVGC